MATDRDRDTPPDPIRVPRDRLNTAPRVPRPRQPIPREELTETQDSPQFSTRSDGFKNPDVSRETPRKPAENHAHPSRPTYRRNSPPPQELPPTSEAEYGQSRAELQDEREARQEAERERDEARAELRRQARKSSPRVESPSYPPTPSGQQDRAALWIGRSVIWLITKARKLGWGGLTGAIGVASILFGSDRLRTVWESMIANNADVAAQRSDNERNAEQIEELWTYVACLEESTGGALESLTPPKDGASRSATKIATFERKCKRSTKPVAKKAALPKPP